MKTVITVMLAASICVSTISEAPLKFLRGNSIGKEIEAIWGRFWEEDVRNKIPNSVGEDIYAVYTDYESYFTEAYTLIIVLAVNSFDDVSEEFSSIIDEYRLQRRNSPLFHQ